MLCEKSVGKYRYGVATISRLLKIIGRFCRISSLLWGSFAKETCNFKEPTSLSHHRFYVTDHPFATCLDIYINTYTYINIQTKLHGIAAYLKQYNRECGKSHLHPYATCIYIYVYIYIYIHIYIYIYE